MPRSRTKIRYGGQYTVRVTEADICDAVPGDASNCAIARALKRTHPEATYIRVGRGTISFTDKEKGNRITLRTSLKALEAQEKLDRGKLVDPADFPPIRIFMDEAKIEPVKFNEHKRLQQNKRRADIRAGKRVPVPMSEEGKAARRAGRRHA